MKTSLMKSIFIASSLSLVCVGVRAENEGMIESLSGTNINNASVLKDNGIEIGGWTSVGITYASNNNDAHSNAPISFNERINDVMLNQVNLYLQKAVKAEGSNWDIGGRADFMFGTDANNTQATGWDDKILGNPLTDPDEMNNYDVAFPQVYAEIYAPVGNGLTTKVGHFYTNIGYEVVPSKDNFFYSHAYTMLYGEPFTHWGFLSTYKVNDNLSVSGGAVTGWDNFYRNGGDWSFLGGANWHTDDNNTSIAVSLISGENGNDSVGQNTTMYSIVIAHNISEKLHYVFQHDLGVIEDGEGPGNDSDWYGINQYLFYDINDQLSAGIRGEWFNDNGGAYRVATIPVLKDANYYAVSVGLNYKPLSWLKFRPEVRYDWADTNKNGGIYDLGNENDQVAVAMDMVITF